MMMTRAWMLALLLAAAAPVVARAFSFLARPPSVFDRPGRLASLSGNLQSAI